eukprot:jgi/Bigna1/88394/estExt_fgenesh1_pg.C_310128
MSENNSFETYQILYSTVTDAIVGSYDPNIFKRVCFIQISFHTIVARTKDDVRVACVFRALKNPNEKRPRNDNQVWNTIKKTQERAGEKGNMIGLRIAKALSQKFQIDEKEACKLIRTARSCCSEPPGQDNKTGLEKWEKELLKNAFILYKNRRESLLIAFENLVSEHLLFQDGHPLSRLVNDYVTELLKEDEDGDLLGNLLKLVENNHRRRIDPSTDSKLKPHLATEIWRSLRIILCLLGDIPITRSQTKKIILLLQGPLGQDDLVSRTKLMLSFGLFYALRERRNASHSQESEEEFVNTLMQQASAWEEDFKASTFDKAYRDLYILMASSFEKMSYKKAGQLQRGSRFEKTVEDMLNRGSEVFKRLHSDLFYADWSKELRARIKQPLCETACSLLHETIQVHGNLFKELDERAPLLRELVQLLAALCEVSPECTRKLCRQHREAQYSYGFSSFENLLNYLRIVKDHHGNEMATHYLHLLASLCNHTSGVQLVLKLEGGGATRENVDEMRSYASVMRNLLQELAQPSKWKRMVAVLKLIQALSHLSPSTLTNDFAERMLSIMLQRLAKTNNDVLKAAVVDTLAACGTSKPALMKKVWQYVEGFKFLPRAAVQYSAPTTMIKSDSDPLEKKRGGMVLALEEEARKESFPLTIAFGKLILSAINTCPVIIYGVKMEQPHGLGPYLTFLTNNVLLRVHTFKLKEPSQKWELAAAPLAVISILSSSSSSSNNNNNNSKTARAPRQADYEETANADSLFVAVVKLLGQAQNKIEKVKKGQEDLSERVPVILPYVEKVLKLSLQLLDLALQRENAFWRLASRPDVNIRCSFISSMLIRNSEARKSDIVVAIAKCVGLVDNGQVIGQAICFHAANILRALCNRNERTQGWNTRCKVVLVQIILNSLTRRGGRAELACMLLGLGDEDEEDMMPRNNHEKECLDQILLMIEKPRFSVSAAGLAEACFELFYRLYKHPRTSKSFASYLRNKTAYTDSVEGGEEEQTEHGTPVLFKLLRELEEVWGGGAMRGGSSSGHTPSSLLQYSWLLKTIAIDIFSTRKRGNQWSDDAHDTLCRLGFWHSEDRKSSLLSSENNNNNATHTNNNGYQQSQMQMLELLDRLCIRFPTLKPLPEGFSTGSLRRQISPRMFVYDIPQLKAVLLSSGNPQSSANILGIALEWNRQVHRLRACEEAVEGWRQLAEVALKEGAKTQQGHSDALKYDSALYDLLNGVLQKLSVGAQMWGSLGKQLSIALSSVALAVMAKINLRTRQHNNPSELISSASDMRHIVEAILEAILRSRYQLARKNLYVVFVNYIQYLEHLEIFLNEHGADAIRANDSSSYALIEDDFSTFFRHNITVIGKYGKKILQVSCQDAMSGQFVVRSTAMVFIANLLKYDSPSSSPPSSTAPARFDRRKKSRGVTNTLLHFLCETGNVHQFANELLHPRRVQVLRTAIVSTQLEHYEQIASFEVMASLLTQIALKEQGAKQLLGSKLILKLAECQFLGNYQDFSGISELSTSAKVAVSQSSRYYQLLIPSLRLVSCLLTTLPENQLLRREVANFLKRHQNVLGKVLEESVKVLEESVRSTRSSSLPRLLSREIIPSLQAAELLTGLVLAFIADAKNPLPETFIHSYGELVEVMKRVVYRLQEAAASNYISMDYEEEVVEEEEEEEDYAGDEKEDDSKEAYEENRRLERRQNNVVGLLEPLDNGILVYEIMANVFLICSHNCKGGTLEDGERLLTAAGVVNIFSKEEPLGAERLLKIFERTLRHTTARGTTAAAAGGDYGDNNGEYSSSSRMQSDKLQKRRTCLSIQVMESILQILCHNLSNYDDRKGSGGGHFEVDAGAAQADKKNISHIRETGIPLFNQLLMSRPYRDIATGGTYIETLVRKIKARIYRLT